MDQQLWLFGCAANFVRCCSMSEKEERKVSPKAHMQFILKGHI
jgi:hypothetical protein